ncbi:hypothetical protein CPB83DRAFT_876800 [Crepidotus variabilis]|uniref:BTB domain-containing protein n=1 Tax=Crepidotus variabilis TaxID=179855 RepID=A0A9P6EBS1_9AGAR|nr:hypothetical protein CPB83DRAFT_876800 [Crepidotus variabilis]
MSDFSTNRHAESLPGPATRFSDAPVAMPARHPDIWFSDGNIILVAGGYYFRVHLGLLCRHSAPMRQLITTLVEKRNSCKFIEHQVAIDLSDQPQDLCRFLLALYDGTSGLKFDTHDFESVSALLRLSTKYGVEHIRRDILRGLSTSWPRTLSAWENREAEATDGNGNYKPRTIYPHPIALLPAAFYDLCRSSASDIATGFTFNNSSGASEDHMLSDEDLLNALRGREHASRFLSTFVVGELEGRETSPSCIYKNDLDPLRKRICEATFEATTFEVLRDVNGVVFNRSSDPLFAIMDADLMQGRGDGSSGRLRPIHRACEPCRLEFAGVVDSAREEMWRKIPSWFGLNIPNW